MRKFNITVNGTTYEVEVEEITGTSASTPQAAPVSTPKASPATPKAAPVSAAGSVKITSPMPGTIMKVSVSAGQAVKKGDIVCILEAMKMENEIFAPRDGRVASVNVSQGATVNSGDLLVSLM
ncbi:MAG: biotin/lipoyl-binding protein [Clostridia bacterium]|nr:biotin/lipoyl-binding protein [Clostridia bacterium]